MSRDLSVVMVSHDSPATVELSTVIGVGGCGHCISANEMHWMTPSFILVNRAAASASEATEMMLAKMPLVFRIGLLCGFVVMSRLPK